MFRNHFMYFKRPSVWRYSVIRPLYFGFLYFFKTESSLKPHLKILNFSLHYAAEGQHEQFYKSCLLIFGDYKCTKETKRLNLTCCRWNLV